MLFLFQLKMETLTLCVIAGFVSITIIACIVLVVVVSIKSKEKFQPRKNKEGFLLTTQPARISEVTGAITGQGIMTDQMVRTPMAEITKQVNSNGLVHDGGISIGVNVGEGFDKVYQNQLDIQAVDDKAEGGYQQREDLTEISKKIGTSTNNASFNLYSRGGSAPTKLLLAPNEVRCVIDESYLPERDKNRQIATVGTVIPMQGYDINIERLDQDIIGTHFAQFSPNKLTKGKRTPTAAGTNKVDESAVQDAVEESIKTDGSTVEIKDAAVGADVAVKVDNAPETFTKYAKYF